MSASFILAYLLIYDMQMEIISEPAASVLHQCRPVSALCQAAGWDQGHWGTSPAPESCVWSGRKTGRPPDRQVSSAVMNPVVLGL